MREDEGLADRATFVVDPQGIIQAIEVTAEGIGRDASDLLRKIKQLSMLASHPGEVCRLNGKKVKRLWLRLWTWLAKSKIRCVFHAKGALATLNRPGHLLQ
ncbi:Alkyl hydroperoxide reductase subunit C [Kluyvera cryocrescens]|uniref:Alkyl hydroperoxide reductase C n=1 Tax=Kluyvera cryocrescens TaxID=580 RepID=A0A485CJP9_KLUCR|nr:Alkyl hydroperoxide reductase subunit C [Kluyvera cryocrescens]